MPIDFVALNTKEIRVESVWRYCNAYPRAISLIESGKVDVKWMVTRTFPFDESVRAFDEAAAGNKSDVKIQILFEQN